MTMLTVEGFREEMKAFTKEVLHVELMTLKKSIVSELAANVRSSGIAQNAQSTNFSEKTRKFADKGPSATLRARDLGIAPRGEEGHDDNSPLRNGGPFREASLFGENPSSSMIQRRQIDNGAAYASPRMGYDRDQRKSTLEVIDEVVHSQAFNNVSVFIILLSVALIILETDFQARYPSKPTPPGFSLCDNLTFTFFFTEISLRIYSEGLQFFVGAGWKGNWFDLLIVFSQACGLDIWIINDLVYDFGINYQSIKMVRILRVLRVARAARLLALIKELELLLSLISSSAMSLFWAMTVLTLVTICFAITLTQVVTEHKIRRAAEGKELNEELDAYYGTLDRSVLSLYEAISEGIHWAELLKPLTEEITPHMGIAFALYFGFMSFGLMNIIEAFFVESVMRDALGATNAKLCNKLAELFPHSSISRTDFTDALESPQMEEYLENLELTADDARSCDFFSLLDSDQSGSVDKEELLDACKRLTGPARAIDFAAFCYKYNSDSVNLARHARRTEAALQEICGEEDLDLLIRQDQNGGGHADDNAADESRGKRKSMFGALYHPPDG